MKKLLITAAVVLAGSFGASKSWAVTCAGSIVAGSTACADSTVLASGPGNSGNPLAQYVDPFGDGLTWDVLGSQIDGNATELTFGSWEVRPRVGGPVDDGTKSGTWSVNFWPVNYPDVAFAFKGGNSFAMFRMDTTGATSGDWTLDQNALSNFRIFTTAGTQPPDPHPGNGTGVIPLPAPALLLIGGLGALGAVRRLRSA